MVWEEFPPVISRYAISFLLNHDPYLLIIRSDVIFSVCFCDRGRGRDQKRMESMRNSWEIEREDTLTAKVQKLNQKVHCRARGWHAACLSRAIAMRRRRHTVSKNYFVPLLTLLVCLFSRHRGCARRQKKFQRSRKHHERFAELDIVHNQAFIKSKDHCTG